MNLWALISLTAAITTFTVGIISFKSEGESPLFLIFTLMCFSFALHSFAEYEFLLAESYGRAKFWMAIGSLWAISISISLHFILIYTGKWKRFRNPVILITYFSAVVIAILNLSTNLITVWPVKMDYGWTYTIPEEAVFFYLVSFWAFIIAMVNMVLLFFHYRQAKDRALKRQVLFILIGSLVLIILVISLDFLSLVGDENFPNLFSLGVLLSTLIISYAIIKYRIFSINLPETIKHVLSSMSDVLVIVNTNGEITGMNTVVAKRLGYSDTELNGNMLAILFPDSEWQKINNENDGSFNLNNVNGKEFELIDKKGKRIPFLVSLSKIKNRRKMSEGFILLGMDLSERKEIEEELRISEGKYRTLVENLSEGIVVVDKNEIFTFANPKAEKIFGVDPGDLVGQNLENFMDSKNSLILREQAKIRRQGLKESYKVEIINPVEGKHFIYITASPVLNKDGVFEGSFGVIRDITEQIRAEKKISTALKEKEILLKEIHHRVKNNLQIIASMLNMQIRVMKDKEASILLKESRGRIYSMSLIHENLYQSDKITFIEIKEYVNKLAANLLHSFGISSNKISLKIDINSIYLNINQAIPIGLILNELITNSFKYAFKPNMRGVIKIEISIDKTEQITLVYFDNGVPFSENIDITGSETIGLRLIDTLARQLNASLDFPDRSDKSYIIKFFKQQIDREMEK